MIGRRGFGRFVMLVLLPSLLLRESVEAAGSTVVTVAVLARGRSSCRTYTLRILTWLHMLLLLPLQDLSQDNSDEPDVDDC